MGSRLEQENNNEMKKKKETGNQELGIEWRPGKWAKIEMKNSAQN
jgi:hypothetical protein